MEKAYRIKANINNDTYINVPISRDFDNFEILSLNISTENVYKLHTSKYGCIVGRVLANGSFGVPNVKISVFIETEESEDIDPILYNLYSYSDVLNKGVNEKRYNLLPDEQVSDCHQVIGDFPNKRLVLDDNNVLEIYDKYYKYSTVTNESGDYMIFGVPVGQHTIHSDVDLSDIGILSQKPRDFMYKGYNLSLFNNPSQFKDDKDLDTLPQVISSNTTVYVNSFWGDSNENVVAITRNDINLDYKFEPTCIFLGSLITDNQSNGISKQCIANDKMGLMEEIVTSQGTIEMIRKTNDGNVESFNVQGSQLIDGNGIWCYQIPMNLDYVGTDEYGNTILTNDETKGIPTRARVRFRMSLIDNSSQYTVNHLSKVLVPNNPENFTDLDYAFGDETKDDEYGTKSYRDLFYNNVYTVKSYIPRIQKGNNQRNKRFTGIKDVSAVSSGVNPLPYNNMRVNFNFMFVLQCAILKILIKIIQLVNSVNIFSSKCLYIGDGICPDLENWYFAPGCKKQKKLKNTLEVIKGDDSDAPNDKFSIDDKNKDTDDEICIANKIDYLMQCIEINLATENRVINFDFYNDWINGVIYIPRWFGMMRKKTSYLFNLIKIKPKVYGCLENSFNGSRRYTQQCALTYSKNSQGYYTTITNDFGCSRKGQNCHKKKGRVQAKIMKNTLNGGGLVHSEETIKKELVYYIKPCEWMGTRKAKCNLFATDIVLLGSLNECNIQGIPQAFVDIPSTTYKIPNNLVDTNMDSNGALYDGLCSTTNTNNGISPLKQTFDAYKQFNGAKNDTYEENAYEYAITEMSGIDWGKSGPNQYHDANGNTTYYQPGGHFLGISCVNSETNVKSCVNLSRICEVGVIPSQRQMIIRKQNDGEFAYTYSYLIPTGLISKNEITDSNFRNIFATLNHNNLKTKVDSKSNLLIYDFKPLLPINFNGEFEKFVKQGDSANEYNSVGRLDDESKTIDLQTSAYTVTYEETSSDYMKFRLGIDNPEQSEGKYLYSNGYSASLPMYNNSFYFYFGLKNGYTAYDKFLHDYYSICPSKEVIKKPISIIETNNPYVCNEYGGSVKVNVGDLYGKYTFVLYDENMKQIPISTSGNKKCDYEANTNATNYITTVITASTSEFTICNLPEGKYNISITNESMETFSASFELVLEEPPFFQNIIVEAHDYQDVMYNPIVYSGNTIIQNGSYNGYIVKNGIDKNKSGYIIVKVPKINDVGIDGNNLRIMVNDEDYYTINQGTYSGGISEIRNEYQPNMVERFVTIDDMSDSDYIICTIYVWEGNESYVISINACGDSDTNLRKFTEVTINMPTFIDGYIGDVDVTCEKLEKKCGVIVYEDNGNGIVDTYKMPHGITAPNVLETRLRNGISSNGLTDAEMWMFKKGLTYGKNVFAFDSDGIQYGIINKNSKLYDIIETCNGERIVDGLIEVSQSTNLTTENGWNVDSSNHVVPTMLNDFTDSLIGTNSPYISKAKIARFKIFGGIPKQNNFDIDITY